MKKCVNGNYIDMTDAEIAAMQSAADQAEREYWASVDYGDAVNAEIRKRYSESEEFAVIRQQATKPEEYAAYYAYCEECKEIVKAKKAAVE